ncbi:MAG: hypothetical protein WC308_03165 [archaeon]|jgi:hypothetical protein
MRTPGNRGTIPAQKPGAVKRPGRIKKFCRRIRRKVNLDRCSTTALRILGKKLTKGLKLPKGGEYSINEFREFIARNIEVINKRKIGKERYVDLYVRSKTRRHITGRIR